MKNLKSNASIVILAIVISSFTSMSTEKKVNAEESKISWKGSKVTGSHDGNIQLKEGTLIFDGEQLTGGHFVVDMTTIQNNDLSGEWKEKKFRPYNIHTAPRPVYGAKIHPYQRLIDENLSHFMEVH